MLQKQLGLTGAVLFLVGACSAPSNESDGELGRAEEASSSDETQMEGMDAPVSQEDLGAIQEGIINGSTSNADYIVKTLREKSNGDWGMCSATLLRNNIVLTANHCVGTADGGYFGRHLVDNPAGTRAEVDSLDDIREHPDVDLAVVRLDRALPIAGSTSGRWRSLYYGTAASLEGKGVYCYGYGQNNCDETGSGTQRVGKLAVQSADNSRVNYLPNAQGQIMKQGDSGGPCFFDGSIIGVHKAMSCSSAWDTPTYSNADWIRQQVSDLSDNYFTSFSSTADLADWEFHESQYSDGGPARWEIINGALQQRANIGTVAPGPEGAGAQAVVKDVVIGDAWVATKIWSNDDDTAGVLFRYQNEFNYYRLAANESWTRIQKVQNGVSTTLASGPAVEWSNGVELGIWVLGTTIHAHVNGVRVMTATDSTFMDGRAGVYNRFLQDARHVYFDLIHK